MEGLTGLSHLFVTMFVAGIGAVIAIPSITDVTMAALCPGQDQCSLAIYLTGFQHAVSLLLLLLHHLFLFNISLLFNFQFSSSSSSFNNNALFS
jgi:hypothetical protein